MNKFILLLLFVLPFASKAQSPEKGTIAYLDYKKGFKNIKLGSDISTIINKVKLLQTKDDGTTVYDYTDKADNKIGDIGIDGILIVSYAKTIMRIIVFFDKGTGNSVDDIFRSAYGRYSEKPNQFMSIYNWNGTDIKLSLNYDDESSKPTAMFVDNLSMSRFEKESSQKNRKAADQL
jgi:hypothetical protein